MSFHHRDNNLTLNQTLAHVAKAAAEMHREVIMLSFQPPAPLGCDACGTFLELTQQNTANHEITATETYCLVSLEGRTLKSRHWWSCKPTEDPSPAFPFASV